MPMVEIYTIPALGRGNATGKLRTLGLLQSD